MNAEGDAMTPDPEAIVTRQVEAYNARDLDALVEFYADDAVILGSHGEVIAEGNDAIRAVFADVFNANPALHAELPTAIRVGSWVAIHSIVQDWVPRSGGSPGEMRWSELYEVTDGLIQRVQLFS